MVIYVGIITISAMLSVLKLSKLEVLENGIYLLFLH
jgi:hypothetical protein